MSTFSKAFRENMKSFGEEPSLEQTLIVLNQIATGELYPVPGLFRELVTNEHPTIQTLVRENLLELGDAFGKALKNPGIWPPGPADAFGDLLTDEHPTVQSLIKEQPIVFLRAFGEVMEERASSAYKVAGAFRDLLIDEHPVIQSLATERLYALGSSFGEALDETNNRPPRETAQAFRNLLTNDDPTIQALIKKEPVLFLYAFNRAVKGAGEHTPEAAEEFGEVLSSKGSPIADLVQENLYELGDAFGKAVQGQYYAHDVHEAAKAFRGLLTNLGRSFDISPHSGFTIESLVEKHPVEFLNTLGKIGKSAGSSMSPDALVEFGNILASDNPEIQRIIREAPVPFLNTIGELVERSSDQNVARILRKIEVEFGSPGQFIDGFDREAAQLKGVQVGPFTKRIGGELARRCHTEEQLDIALGKIRDAAMEEIAPRTIDTGRGSFTRAQQIPPPVQEGAHCKKAKV